MALAKISLLLVECLLFIGGASFDLYSPLVNEGAEQDEVSVTEVSYLQEAQQTYNGHTVVWTGSDGSQTSISAVDIETGEIVKTFPLDIAPSHEADWEAMARGPCTSLPDSNICLYLGDVGNNGAQICNDTNCKKGRDEVRIFKLEEPDIFQDVKDPLKVTTLVLDYHHPDMPTNSADCESMFIDHTGDNAGGKPGDLYLVTKRYYEPSLSRLAKVPVDVHENLSPGSTQQFSLIPVSKPYEDKTWTDADMTVDGTLIVMRDYYGVNFFPRPPSKTVSEAISLPPCPFYSETLLVARKQIQFETVAIVGNQLAEISECPGARKCEVVLFMYDLQFSESHDAAIAGLHTSAPTSQPTVAPTTARPTKLPTNNPTAAPSPAPSTALPTTQPTSKPSTPMQSKRAMLRPSAKPSSSPDAQGPIGTPTSPISSPSSQHANGVPTLPETTSEPTLRVTRNPSTLSSGLFDTNPAPTVAFAPSKIESDGATSNAGKTVIIPLSSFLMGVRIIGLTDSDSVIVDESILAQRIEVFLKEKYLANLDLPSDALSISVQVERVQRDAGINDVSSKSDGIVVTWEGSVFVTLFEKPDTEALFENLTRSDFDKLTTAAVDTIVATILVPTVQESLGIQS